MRDGGLETWSELLVILELNPLTGGENEVRAKEEKKFLHKTGMGTNVLCFHCFVTLFWFFFYVFCWVWNGVFDICPM